MVLDIPTSIEGALNLDMLDKVKPSKSFDHLDNLAYEEARLDVLAGNTLTVPP
jgi:hypothetical protein